MDKIKVVIIGQDPYHEPGQAHGLCFSVNDGVKFPPSLQNIYKEIASEYNQPMPQSGNLTRWAEQGVLLLNSRTGFLNALVKLVMMPFIALIELVVNLF